MQLNVYIAEENQGTVNTGFTSKTQTINNYKAQTF